MFRSILVPLNGSERSEHALPVALSLARRTGARVDVVLVHEPDRFYLSDLDRDRKRAHEQYLRDLAAYLPWPLHERSRFHLVEGLVEEALEFEIATRDVDLVVMTTDGRSRLSRLLLGSITDRLVRRLPVSVLLVQPPDRPARLTWPASFRRILVPLDGTESSETILTMGRALENSDGAAYHLLRVLPPASPPEARQRAGAYLGKIAQELRHDATRAETQVVTHAQRGAAIQAEARAAGCDLIVQATPTHTGFWPHLAFGKVPNGSAGVDATVLSYLAPWSIATQPSEEKEMVAAGVLERFVLPRVRQIFQH